MDVRRTTRSFGHRHRPPVLHGRLMRRVSSTLRSQLPQISRKCAHFDARRYVRGSVRIFLTLECTGPTDRLGHRTLRSGVEV